jgi:transcriptional regulator with XRE-family HTH domain
MGDCYKTLAATSAARPSHGYAAVGIDLTDLQLDEPWPPAWAPPAAVPAAIAARRQAVLIELGRAALRLRLFLGWTQRDVEFRSGVDQTTISRFERGRQTGMSIMCLAAILEALKAGRIDVLPPPGPPPTALELMLYGDSWRRAGEEADRRLARQKPEG